MKKIVIQKAGVGGIGKLTIGRKVNPGGAQTEGCGCDPGPYGHSPNNGTVCQHSCESTYCAGKSYGKKGDLVSNPARTLGVARVQRTTR
jgi:hypothetical protein